MNVCAVNYKQKYKKNWKLIFFHLNRWKKEITAGPYNRNNLINLSNFFFILSFILYFIDTKWFSHTLLYSTQKMHAKKASSSSVLLCDCIFSLCHKFAVKDVYMGEKKTHKIESIPRYPSLISHTLSHTCYYFFKFTALQKKKKTMKKKCCKKFFLSSLSLTLFLIIIINKKNYYDNQRVKKNCYIIYYYRKVQRSRNRHCTQHIRSSITRLGRSNYWIPIVLTTYTSRYYEMKWM